MKYENLSAAEKASFDKMIKEHEEKEMQFYRDRGMSPAQIMAAGFAYKAYLEGEQRMPNSRPFDKAPALRRVFIMGWYYGCVK